MPRERVGRLWILHAKSVPRHGLWERRELGSGAAPPEAGVPRRGEGTLRRRERGRARPRPEELGIVTGSSFGSKRPRSGCITTSSPSRSPTSSLALLGASLPMVEHSRRVRLSLPILLRLTLRRWRFGFLSFSQ